MNLITGRSEYPRLARHLDYDFPQFGYDPIIVNAFKKFTAYHPTEKLTGFDQTQFQTWLGWDSDPIVTILKPMQPASVGLNTGIAASASYADRYEEESRGYKYKAKGALAGREVYQVTAQLLALLVRWAIFYRDNDKRPIVGWTTEEPAQAFLDHLYGTNEFFWY